MRRLRSTKRDLCGNQRFEATFPSNLSDTFRHYFLDTRREAALAFISSTFEQLQLARAARSPAFLPFWAVFLQGAKGQLAETGLSGARFLLLYRQSTLEKSTEKFSNGLVLIHRTNTKHPKIPPPRAR